MATIRKLPSGRYQAVIRRAGLRPTAGTFDDRSDAVRWATKIEHEINSDTHFGESYSKTVADVIDKCLAERAPIASQRDFKRYLAWWRANFGGLLLKDMKRDKIAEGKRMLQDRGIKAQTVVHYLNAISSVFTFLLRETTWIGERPIIARPTVRNTVIRWLKPGETEQLLAAVDASSNSDLALFVRIAMCSGARAGEILSLRWPMIDWARECAFLPKTKNNQARAAPIVGDALEMLRERAKVRRLDTDLVFPSPNNPKRPRYMQWSWNTARKQAGLPDFRIHDLRHDCATRMLRSGVDSRVVMEVLGHVSSSMLRRYQHVAPEFVVAAAKRGMHKP